MNSTYIKRQIILNDLGIKIDPDIKKCINLVSGMKIHMWIENVTCDNIFFNDYNVGYYSYKFDDVKITDISIFIQGLENYNIKMIEQDFVHFLKDFIKYKFNL